MPFAFPAPGSLEAFGLYLVRSSALILATPLFGMGTSFSGYKVALIAALAYLSYSVSGVPLAADLSPLHYGLFLLREVVIGLALAFSLHCVLLAVKVGAELIGHEMAFTMSSVVDPATGTSISTISQFYELLFFLAMLSVGGHHWILRALAESYERAPVGAITLEGGVASAALSAVAELFAAGLTFVAPVLVLLAIVTALIGLLARAVPQLNMMEFGFNLRILGGLCGMLLFAPMLEPALGSLLDQLMLGLEAGLDALGAQK